jgi:hypothetical protein
MEGESTEDQAYNLSADDAKGDQRRSIEERQAASSSKKNIFLKWIHLR